MIPSLAEICEYCQGRLVREGRLTQGRHREFWRGHGELTREPADDIGRKGLVEAQDELLNACVCIGCDAFANRLRRTDQPV